MSKPKKTEEPSAEEMRAALEAAGKEIPEGATDEEIALLRLELELEAESVLETPPAPETPPEEIETPEPSSEVVGTIPEDEASEQSICIALEMADPNLGDKDPKFVEWARANMTPEQFETRYAGRKVRF